MDVTVGAGRAGERAECVDAPRPSVTVFSLVLIEALLDVVFAQFSGPARAYHPLDMSIGWPSPLQSQLIGPTQVVLC